MTAPTGDHGHLPVLPRETLDLLAPAAGDTGVDLTAGRGGHSELIAKAVGPGGRLVLVDLDPANLAHAAARVRGLEAAPEVVELRASFAETPRRLASMGIGVDLALADLGFASTQMEDPARGLSFSRPGPLDMRFDPGGPVTAADLVRTLSEDELGEILREFGEERHWKRLARKLVEEREREPITTTARLADIVRRVVRPRPKDRIDPATRTFQALRIAVNDELGALEALLEAVERAAGGPPGAWLKRGARVAIISFHSLEDRLVKRAFAGLAERRLAEPLTKKPVEAGDEERGLNPRSRSAKLRAIRLTDPVSDRG